MMVGEQEVLDEFLSSESVEPNENRGWVLGNSSSMAKNGGRSTRPHFILPATTTTSEEATTRRRTMGRRLQRLGNNGHDNSVLPRDVFDGDDLGDDPTESDVTIPDTDEPSTTPTSTPLVISSPPSSSPNDTFYPSESFIPSVAISSEPSESLSLAPSSSNAPSSAPASPVSPTLSPVNVTEQRIAASQCVVNANGLFGEETAVPQALEYAYEVQTERSITSSILQSALMPPIEEKVGNTLIPAFFSDDCSEDSTSNTDSQSLGSSTGRLGRSLRGRNEVRWLQSTSVAGLSVLPGDVLLEGVPCTVEVESGRRCYVVDGSATMYMSSNSNDPTAVLNLARQRISSAMNSGEYNDVDGVVNITSRDISTLPEPGTSPAAAPGGQTIAGMPLYAWIFVGGGLLFLVGLIICCIMYRQGCLSAGDDRGWDGGNDGTDEDYGAYAPSNKQDPYRLDPYRLPSREDFVDEYAGTVPNSQKYEEEEEEEKEDYDEPQYDQQYVDRYNGQEAYSNDNGQEAYSNDNAQEAYSNDNAQGAYSNDHTQGAYSEEVDDDVESEGDDDSYDDDESESYYDDEDDEYTSESDEDSRPPPPSPQRGRFT